MGAELILVTGATGNTGSAVLPQLRERGAHVRAMTRAVRRRGSRIRPSRRSWPTLTTRTRLMRHSTERLARISSRRPGRTPRRNGNFSPNVQQQACDTW